MDSMNAVNNSQVIASWALVVFTLLLAYVTWRYAKATKELQRMSENQVLLQLCRVFQEKLQLTFENLKLKSDPQFEPKQEAISAYEDVISTIVDFLSKIAMKDMVVQPKPIRGLYDRLRSLVRWICIGQMPGKHTHLHTLIKFIYSGRTDDSQ